MVGSYGLCGLGLIGGFVPASRDAERICSASFPSGKHRCRLRTRGAFFFAFADRRGLLTIATLADLGSRGGDVRVACVARPAAD